MHRYQVKNTIFKIKCLTWLHIISSSKSILNHLFHHSHNQLRELRELRARHLKYNIFKMFLYFKSQHKKKLTKITLNWSVTKWLWNIPFSNSFYRQCREKNRTVEQRDVLSYRYPWLGLTMKLWFLVGCARLLKWCI